MVASITTRTDSTVPVFILDQNPSNQVLTAKISTFEALQKVLNVLPADRKLAEVHDILLGTLTSLAVCIRKYKAK